jgi:hypothetical protein
MNTHLYKHTRTYFTSMSIFERLSRLDLEIHEFSHQKQLTVNEHVVSY